MNTDKISLEHEEITEASAFEGVIMGEYEADLLVDGKALVELKVAKEYNPKDEPQLLNGFKSNRDQGKITHPFWQRESRIQTLQFLKKQMLNSIGYQCFIRVNPWLKSLMSTTLPTLIDIEPNFYLTL